MTAPVTRLIAKGRPAAQVTAFTPPTPPALPAWLTMQHRWLASWLNPGAGSEIHSVPDAAGSSADPLLRLMPGVNNNPGDVGSPEPTLITAADGSQALRVSGIDVGGSGQISTVGRVFWAVFRSPVAAMQIRLGGLTFGRNGNLAGRVSLTGGKYQQGDVASRSATLLAIAAWFDPTNVLSACNGTPQTGDTTYTASTQSALLVPMTVVDKGSGAVGSRTLDLVEMGVGATPVVSGTGRAPTQQELNDFTLALFNAYPGLQS